MLKNIFQFFNWLSVKLFLISYFHSFFGWIKSLPIYFKIFLQPWLVSRVKRSIIIPLKLKKVNVPVRHDSVPVIKNTFPCISSKICEKLVFFRVIFLLLTFYELKNMLKGSRVFNLAFSWAFSGLGGSLDLDFFDSARRTRANELLFVYLDFFKRRKHAAPKKWRLFVCAHPAAPICRVPFCR